MQNTSIAPAIAALNAAFERDPEAIRALIAQEIPYKGENGTTGPLHLLTIALEAITGQRVSIQVDGVDPADPRLLAPEDTFNGFCLYTSPFTPGEEAEEGRAQVRELQVADPQFSLQVRSEQVSSMINQNKADGFRICTLLHIGPLRLLMPLEVEQIAVVPEAILERDNTKVLQTIGHEIGLQALVGTPTQIITAEEPSLIIPGA